MSSLRELEAEVVGHALQVQMENRATISAAGTGVCQTPTSPHGPMSPHGESRRSFSSFTSERSWHTETNSNVSSQDELVALRAQMKELQAQATRAVEMNVEMTSLRNQVGGAAYSHAASSCERRTRREASLCERRVVHVYAQQMQEGLLELWQKRSP